MCSPIGLSIQAQVDLFDQFQGLREGQGAFVNSTARDGAEHTRISNLTQAPDVIEVGDTTGGDHRYAYRLGQSPGVG